MSHDRKPSKKSQQEVDEDYEVLEADQSESSQSGRVKSSKGTTKSSGGIPGGSTFNDLFQSDRSIWIKVLGGAVATPIILVVLMLRAKRRGGGAGANIDLTSPTMLGVLMGSVVLGGALGALLTAKDVVQRRLVNSQPVAFPWRLLFGMRMVSVGCVWIPVAIVVIITSAIVALNLM